MPAAEQYIFIGIEIGDVRQAYHDTVCHAVVVQEPLQVIEHTLVVLARVSPVDIGVDVLDVDDVFMNEWQEALEVLTVNVEGCLYREVPLGWCDAAKRLDKLAADSRLAAAEGDSAACGKKIEVVDLHLVEQFGWSDCSGETIGAQALGIQAIAATQRAAVEGNQRGYPLAVHRQAMTSHRYDGCPKFHRIHSSSISLISSVNTKVTGRVYHMLTTLPFK